MKKIFTLLFSAGVFTNSFAQTSVPDNKRNDQYGVSKSNTNFKKFDNHRDNIYNFSAKERDMQISKNNGNFNLKVKLIISNRRIKKNQKRILIQKAQKEKDQQIQAVNAKFNSKFNAAFNDLVKKYDNRKH